MSNNNTKEKQYIEAKKKVYRLKIFYIHLLGYIVLVSLIAYNLIIIEEGPYKNNILLINWSTIIIWGIAIIIHAWTTFKGRFLFTKRWEERKVKEFLNEENEEEEVQIWK